MENVQAQFQMLDSYVKEYTLKTNCKLSESMNINANGEVQFRIVNITEKDEGLIGEIELINNLDLIDNQCDTVFYDQYKEATIIDFFHIYLSSLIDNKEQMNVDDDKNENINQKTKIIMRYIGNLEIELEKAINTQIDKNTNDDPIKKGTSSIKYRITEELFTLKLFKILFLNCFIDYFVIIPIIFYDIQ